MALNRLLYLSAAMLAGRLHAGSIEGRITNSVTGEPVSGVEVRFLDRHSVVSQTATDASGNYRLPNLQDGDYRGQFSKDGFQQATDFYAPPAHVSGDLATRQDASLNPMGSVRGRVIDEDGNPRANVRVECNAQDTSTDDRGEFAFAGLRAGAYTVVAKPDAATRMQDGVRLGIVPVYYPSATQRADATPVKVSWGAEISGLTIRLRAVPVYRVSGLVVDETGRPVAKATVKLLGRPSPADRDAVGTFSPGLAYSLIRGIEPEVARLETREDGSFAFAAVQPGDWRLSAEAGVDEDMPSAGVAALTVADKDIDDARVRLTAPFAVQVGAGDGPASAFQIFLRPMDGQPQLNVDPATNVGKINGIFPGRYGVIDPPSGGKQYVAAVLWGGRDVLGQVVELGQGADPLQIVMRQDVGSVRGTVENGEGASVLLVRREPGEILHYRQTKCGPGGAFQFNGVPPGDYYAVAFDRVSEALPPGDLVETIAPLATSVRVESGSAEMANPRVNRWPE